MIKTLRFINENKSIILILIVAIILRLYHLDFQSAWMDEIYTLNVSNPNSSFSTLINEVNIREGFPYLYFIIIKLLLSIFGYSVVVARTFSACMAVLTIYMIYKFGKQLYNKNVGLISALLFTTGEYCIYISQDARPYTFYLFGIIASFYGLVKFIKQPSQKNALVYGFLAGVLLNINFFAFINLLSQTVIIIFYFYLTPKENKYNFIRNATIAGIIAIVLFIPNYKILLKLLEFKSSWIPAPTNESFKLIFNEFLGNSEITLFIITPLVIFYLVNIFKEKQTQTFQETINNSSVFTFTILLPWIFVYVFILLIKSYTDTSLMISRYFTSILPVFYIILAISIENILNKTIKFAVLSSLMVFMWTNLDVVKKYYDTPSKTQFREASQLIIDKNKNKEIVYTSLKYWFDYYLNSNGIKFTVIEKPNLETIITEMMSDSSKISPFWYTDAHGRPFTLSDNAMQFVTNNLSIDENFDGYDAWTKHFILLKDVKKDIDISKFGVLHQHNGSPFKFSVEVYENINNTLKISGWAYFEGQIASESKIDLVLIKDGKAIIIPSQKVSRPDVTSYFKSDFDVSNSGFSAVLNLNNLQKGNYQLGVFIENKQTNKKGLNLTDKIISK